MREKYWKRPEFAHKVRRALIKAPAMRPQDNVLMGGTMILSYLRMSKYDTLYRWVEQHGFPAMQLPSGVWMATVASIDDWITLLSQVQTEERARMRAAKAKMVNDAELV